MLFRFFGLVVITLSLFCVESRCQSVYIPVFDPVNDDIITLLDKGYLNDIHSSEQPWLVDDVVKAILDERVGFDFESYVLSESILEKLKAPQTLVSDRLFGGSEFGAEIRGLSRERRAGYFISRGRYFKRGFKGELGSIYKAGGWISRGGSWGISTRLIFDSDGTGYPWYYGRPHNARITGQFDHAYAYFDFGYFNVVAGRNRIVWASALSLRFISSSIA